MDSSNESEKKMDCYNFLLLYIKNKCRNLLIKK